MDLATFPLLGACSLFLAVKFAYDPFRSLAAPQKLPVRSVMEGGATAKSAFFPHLNPGTGAAKHFPQ